MMIKIALVFSALVCAAVNAENCFSQDIHKELEPTHKACQKESEDGSHGDTEACFLAYRQCNMKKLGIYDEASKSADHDKFVEWVKKHATESTKSKLVPDLGPCKDSGKGANDTIKAYFDCVENVFVKDCPEVAKYRKEFRSEFDGVSANICKA